MEHRIIHNTVALVWLAVALVATSGIARADFTFGPAQNLGSAVNSLHHDAGPCLSADGLELCFYSDRPGGRGGYDIWVSTRPSPRDLWGPPTNLGLTVNSTYNEAYPSLSSDGLTLYFSEYYSGSVRPAGLGAGDIWMTSRPNSSAPWGTPVNLGAPINSSALDMSPTISGDGLTLVFTSNRPGGNGSWDLWMSTRVSVQDPWGPPVNLGPAVNSGNWDGECALSWDGRAVFFDSGRPGMAGAIDLWMSARRTPAGPWEAAVNLGLVVNSSGNDGTARVSPDMRTIYFCSDRPGGLGSYDLYAATILSIVDFDGSGAVDTSDLLRLIESWGQDDPLCDIGPGPWGDGTVDAADLEVLMSYWGREVNDPSLVAHWPLDEMDGVVVHDQAGRNDGLLMGLPQWQPQGGMVAGALELNGMTFVTATAPLSPADGPFSVLAWVKGGGPGQTILSQQGVANWLMTDAGGGLATELSQSGRAAAMLVSEAIITDGNWHRIGFAWDGAHRRLYADDALAAEDSQNSLPGSSGNLVLGAAKNMAAGSFFSGLIDDVRIYNRAVKP
jgi:hypothetical protein